MRYGSGGKKRILQRTREGSTAETTWAQALAFVCVYNAVFSLLLLFGCEVKPS